MQLQEWIGQSARDTELRQARSHPANQHVFGRTPGPATIKPQIKTLSPLSTLMRVEMFKGWPALGSGCVMSSVTRTPPSPIVTSAFALTEAKAPLTELAPRGLNVSATSRRVTVDCLQVEFATEIGRSLHLELIELVRESAAIPHDQGAIGSLS